MLTKFVEWIDKLFWDIPKFTDPIKNLEDCPHIWGRWEPFGITYQQRFCIFCNKSQIVEMDFEVKK